MLFAHFDDYEREAQRLIEAQLALPAYEMVMKCSHCFNLLDARGAISVTERAAYIGRVRTLARAVAQAYHDSRERLGFPMTRRQHRARPWAGSPMKACRCWSNCSPRNCRRAPCRSWAKPSPPRSSGSLRAQGLTRHGTVLRRRYIARRAAWRWCCREVLQTAPARQLQLKGPSVAVGLDADRAARRWRWRNGRRSRACPSRR